MANFVFTSKPLDSLLTSERLFDKINITKRKNRKRGSKVIYVSSDLHGYPLEKYKALLDKAGFGEEDFLFILGDVIDRGEEGAEILEWLLTRPNVQLILGNHEAMLLACRFLFDEITEESLSNIDGNKLHALSTWQRNGAEPTIKGLRRLLPETREDILSYLSEAPLYEAVSAGGRDYLLVHGGLFGYEEGKPISEYAPHDLLWTRPAIDTEYSDRFITVIGHTPTHFYGSRHKGKLLRTKTWINIDTGAASGGSPMLLRLDDLAEFYVEE